MFNWSGLCAIEVSLVITVRVVFVAYGQLSNLPESNHRTTRVNAVYGKGVNISCDPEEISITVGRDHSDWRVRRIESLDRVCLVDKHCCASPVDNAIRINITKNFARCGNKVSIIDEISGSQQTSQITRAFYEFSNRLVYSGGNAIISRDITLCKFRCRYPVDQIVTARPSDSDVSAHVIKIQDIGGEMRAYNDATFNNEYVGLPSEEQNSVFVQVKIDNVTLPSKKENVNVVSVIRSCTVNDTSAALRQIVNEGCSTDRDTDVYSTGESMSSSLKIDVDRMVALNVMNVKLRCMVDLCVKDSPSACKPSCFRRSKRSKTASQSKYKVEFDGKEFSAVISLARYEDECPLNKEISDVTAQGRLGSTNDLSGVTISTAVACFFVAVLLLMGILIFLHLHQSSEQSDLSKVANSI